MYNSDDYRKLMKRMQELFDYPIIVVVEKSGKSKPTVRKFFQKESIRYLNWESIYDACIELVAEKEKKRRLMFDKQHKLIPTNDFTKNQ